LRQLVVVFEYQKVAVVEQDASQILRRGGRGGKHHHTYVMIFLDLTVVL